MLGDSLSECSDSLGPDGMPALLRLRAGDPGDQGAQEANEILETVRDPEERDTNEEESNHLGGVHLSQPGSERSMKIHPARSATRLFTTGCDGSTPTRTPTPARPAALSLLAAGRGARPSERRSTDPVGRSRRRHPPRVGCRAGTGACPESFRGAPPLLLRPRRVEGEIERSIHNSRVVQIAVPGPANRVIEFA